MEFILSFYTDKPAKHRAYRDLSQSSPYPGAYQREGALIEESQPMYPNYEDLKYYPEFTRFGINHRTKNGYMKRDIPDETWYIDINSIGELMSLWEFRRLPLIIRGNRITIDNSDVKYPVPT